MNIVYSDAKRGALKKTRDDSRYIVSKKLEQQAKLDEERKTRTNRIRNQLANQEGEFKKTQKSSYKFDMEK